MNINKSEAFWIQPDTLSLCWSHVYQHDEIWMLYKRGSKKALHMICDSDHGVNDENRLFNEGFQA